MTDNGATDAPVKQELLHQMRVARQTLLTAIDGLDPDTEVTPGGWRVHDVLGHIASWDREALAAIQAFIANDIPYLTPEFETITAWNEKEVARKAGWPPEQVRLDFQMVRVELEQALRQLDEALLSAEVTLPWHRAGTIRDLFYITCVEHDREHAEAIRSKRQ